MSGHTPGPWRIAATDDTRVLAGPRQTICVSDAVNSDWSEAEANARLIASAPDLFAALRGLYDYARRWPAEDGSRFHVLLEQANAALKAAEGN